MANAARQQDTQTLLHIGGQLLTPLPQAALWWPALRTLIVSDLHLEKGSSFAARGQMLPPYDTASTLQVVEQLVEAFQPQTVISLGDSFHDRSAESRMDAACRQRVRALTSACDWVWVEGNHDPDPPKDLGGRATNTLHMSGLVFRHEPSGEIGEVAGHLHPVAKVVTRHRTLRRKCFVSDGQRLIMPSLGAFTGGLNVLDPAFDKVVEPRARMISLIAGEGVYPVSNSRLRADGPRSGSSRWRMNRA